MFQVILSWRNLPSTPKNLFVLVGIQNCGLLFRTSRSPSNITISCPLFTTSFIHIPSRGISWTEQDLPPFHILLFDIYILLMESRCMYDAKKFFSTFVVCFMKDVIMQSTGSSNLNSHSFLNEVTFTFAIIYYCYGKTIMVISQTLMKEALML